MKCSSLGKYHEGKFRLQRTKGFCRICTLFGGATVWDILQSVYFHLDIFILDILKHDCSAVRGGVERDFPLLHFGHAWCCRKTLPFPYSNKICRKIELSSRNFIKKFPKNLKKMQKNLQKKSAKNC